MSVDTDENNYVDGRYNFSNDIGAKELKATIEDFWREKGHKVKVDIVRAGFHPTIREARSDVRSDMINGYPRSLAEELRAAAQPRLRVHAAAR